MDPQGLDDLKQRHAYETWRDRSTLEENLFIWKFFLSGDELPGWHAHRIQSVTVEGLPPSLHSIWRRPQEEMERLLSVDIFECASRTDAHEFLVRLLGEFQSPHITRPEEGEVGDVAFAAAEDAAVLFARANLVVMMRNAGRELVPVTEFARPFDSDLIRKPETEGVKVVPEIRRFQRGLPLGEFIQLEVEAADPLERPLWFKFFSRSGAVFLVRGELIYQPASAGRQEVTVFALNANRGAASQTLQFVVE